MVGHYSNFGIKIRNEILDESALEILIIYLKEHLIFIIQITELIMNLIID